MGEQFGKYRLDRLLGRGGMGAVWLAHDSETGRTVALKVLAEQVAADADYRKRFQREARLGSSLRHPHIVPIHGFGELDGRLYIDMEYIDGIDLAEMLARVGTLTPTAAVDFVTQAASGLDAAHRAGLIHRDVKPSNILVGTGGHAYLIDFGIAQSLGQTAVTATGMAIGSWAYMAPERFNGTVDARSDVYSLACVLYECLTGRRPYGDTDPARQMHGHLMTDPPRVSTVNRAVPPELDAVIARGMAKDQTHRYPSAREFAAAAYTAAAFARLPHPAPHPSAPDVATPSAQHSTPDVPTASARPPAVFSAQPLLPDAPRPRASQSAAAQPAHQDAPQSHTPRSAPQPPLSGARQPHAPLPQTRRPTTDAQPTPTRVETHPPTRAETQAPLSRMATPPPPLPDAPSSSPETRGLVADEQPTPTRVEIPAPTRVETHSPTRVETHEPTRAETPARTRVETHAPTQVETHTPSPSAESPASPVKSPKPLDPTKILPEPGPTPTLVATRLAPSPVRPAAPQHSPWSPNRPAVQPTPVVRAAKRAAPQPKRAPLAPRWSVSQRRPWIASPPRKYQRRRRKSFLSRVVGALVVLFLTPFMLAAGCAALIAFGNTGSGGGTRTADPSVAVRDGDTAQSAEPPAPVSAGLNSPVRDGKFEFVVTSVDSGVSRIGLQNASGSYSVVTVAVRNISDEPKWFLPVGQRLVDTQGRQVDHNAIATMWQTTQRRYGYSFELQPGQSATTQLVFDVAQDATPSRLELHDFMLSNGATVELN
ncbi:protein kinase domain-containing protein [Nocardia pseudovaccinii]|uniref:serine/threonine-protein kinase n=1 Tax=Nocardia pseudovaccinii TaxID=189540 RepID=UPI003D8E3B6E